MTTKTVQVTTQPTTIVGFHKDRKSLMITVNSGATLYINQNSVNITSEGTPVFVGQSIELTIAEGDEPDQVLYGQTLAGIADVRFIEGFKGVDSITNEMPVNNLKEKKKVA